MAEDTTPGATSELPQPVADPDAQTTVNDFLDYTEFLPSDLVRSLRLIGDLDSTYIDATSTVHELTKVYGTLPSIPASDRPDPPTLRKQIAAALDKAIYCRESTFTEASRLYEVADRHARRLSVIRKKLEALPKPPSRDPTPAPVSPQASRSLNRPYDKTPRLYLHFNDHGGSSTTRPRDRNRKSAGRARAHSTGSSLSESSDLDIQAAIDLASGKIKKPKDKTPRPPKSAQRPRPGPATMSTSTALAMLTPPPPDAKPGSKWAPWFKLTEYEMAVLRKTMKKNAQWTPSDTMIRRELEKKGRGHTHYEAEKARCEAAGEEILDEEPDKTSAGVPAAANSGPSLNGDTIITPTEPARDLKDDTATFNKGMKLNEAKEAKRAKRESQREQALRHAQELEQSAQKIVAAAETLKELNFPADTVATSRRPSRGNKRKRESSSAAPAAETAPFAAGESSQGTQDNGTKPPDAKRLRPLNTNLTLNTAAASPGQPSAPLQNALSAKSGTATSAGPSPLTVTPVPQPTEPAAVSEPSAATVQVPLAPPGPASPQASHEAQTSAAPGQEAASALRSPTDTKPDLHPTTAQLPQGPVSPHAPAPVLPAQPTITAASSRPRRESAAPGKTGTPAAVSVGQQVKAQKPPTPEPKPEPISKERPAPVRAPRVAATRPRSANGHIPTPKAQSEEPKLSLIVKGNKVRRSSIASQPAISVPTRQSTRRKPPPKGDVTSSENGQKSVTTVKRAQGSMSKKKKNADEPAGEADDIDPDEPRYCYCNQESFGEMISCDNHVRSISSLSAWVLTIAVRDRLVPPAVRGHDLRRHPFETLEMVLPRLSGTAGRGRLREPHNSASTTGSSRKPVGRPVILRLFARTEL
jgi:hypothetical protein